MKYLFLFLLSNLLGTRGIAQYSVIDSFRVIPANPTATDTVKIITRHYRPEGFVYLDTVTATSAVRVVRRMCFVESLLDDLSPFEDTVHLNPYGVGPGYWFVFEYRETDDSLSCDAPYFLDRDSILIGPDPYLSILGPTAATALAIHPNPTSTNEVVLSILASPTTSLHLTDLTGRPVTFRRSGVVLYLEGLSPGVYLLHLRDGDRRYTAKLIKQ